MPSPAKRLQRRVKAGAFLFQLLNNAGDLVHARDCSKFSGDFSVMTQKRDCVLGDNVAVFYHARVIIKPERVKDSTKLAFEYDLSIDDLLHKIVVPFVQQKQFFCGGVVVVPSKVQEVRFNRTEQSSRDLAPMIEARRRMHPNVLVFSPPEYEVVWEGDDITRELLDQAHQLARGGQMKAAKQSDRIFIVHGHDETAVDQTEILINRFGLTPIILRNAPSGGRTVIEKFEAHSDVGAAIVLLTPDDIGGLDTGHLLPRARQNVIWEWGYLVGRLGRQNVICLYKGSVEVPSDLHGIVTIHVGDDVREKSEEIRRELKAAGYDIP